MLNLVGEIIDRYCITDLIGKGGMSIVYKAHDSHLQNEVAIKFIQTNMLPLDEMGTALIRFENEARKTARLMHPNIVRVIDYGKYQETPYLVMVYLSGGTLRQKMGHPLPYQEAAHLLAPVARALEYAHNQHIIHRDIKPANILLTDAGQPMLSDFGVAKILAHEGQQDGHLTGTGVGIGTPEYMAPEQVMGLPIDHRVDIYSLGIVFFELLTGQRPFVADTPMAVALKHITEPLPKPKDRVPGLPEQVEQVVIKATAKQPDERYQSMNEFATVLERLAMGQLDEALQAVIPPTHKVVTQPMTVNLVEQREIAQAGKPIEEVAEKGAVAVEQVPPAAEPTVQKAAKTEAISTPLATPAAETRRRRIPLMPVLAALGAGILLIAGVAVVAGIVLTRLFASPTPTIQASPTAIVEALAVENTPASTATSLPSATPLPPTITAIPTLTATATITPIPSATELPGAITIPLDRLQPKIPWLSLEGTATPATFFVGFLSNKPPFDNPLVRQAFALAVDRGKIVNLASGSFYQNLLPATSLVPAETLGRDLYSAVGLAYHPQEAQALLAQAGYPNGEGFPSVTLMYLNAAEDPKIAQALVQAWKEGLGVEVQLKPIASQAVYFSLLASNPSNLYFISWKADYNDPKNFLDDMLLKQANFGKFANTEYEELVRQGEKAAADPAQRQLIYIQAEQVLCEKAAAVIPIFHYQTGRK